MDKVLFCIPTLFKNPEKTIRCVQQLLNQCEKNNIEYKIFVVSNIEDASFSSWDTGVEEVEKVVSGLEYSIAKALNVTIDKYDADFFVFIQDDMLVNDDKWIENFIKIYKNKDLNCGVLGLTSRWGADYYRSVITSDLPYRLEELLWSDGVMFFSTKLLDSVGKFDERYFGDKESQDFCYRALQAGYINYRVNTDLCTHDSTPFNKKVNESKREEFIQKVTETRKLFNSKWQKWEQEMVKIGVKK